MGAEAQVKAAPVSKSIVISNSDDYRMEDDSLRGLYF